MKKRAVVLAGVFMAGSVFAFAGCSIGGSGGTSGKISGNYKEADDATIAQALSSIDMENAFVDTTAKNWKYGLQASASLNLSVNARVGNESASLSARGSADYKISLQKKTSLTTQKETLTVAGAGNVNGSFNMSGGGQSIKASVKANAYHDTDTVYASLNGTIPNTSGIGGGTQKIDMKVKAPIEDIFDEIGGMIPVTAASDEIIGGTTEIDFAEVVDKLRAEGYTVFLDTSKGVKIKLSASEQYVEEVTKNISQSVAGGEITWTRDPVFDIYLAFDAEGKFSQVGFDANVSARVTGDDGTDATVKMTMGISLKVYTGTVTLPDGIAEDDSYLEIGGSGGPSIGGGNYPDYDWNV